VNISGPQLMALTIRLSEDIIHREALLNRLFELIVRMDSEYWKYSVARIKASERLKTIKSKELVELLNTLKCSQKEVSVLIAMIRGMSIVIVENVIKVRKVMKKRIHTSKGEVSIYWKDENYMIKMKHDLSFLNQTITMRWWLGFIAEDLILPPILYNMKIIPVPLGNSNNNNNSGNNSSSMMINTRQSRLLSSKSKLFINHAKQLWINNHRRYII
jgi:hypothetical protein